MSDNLFVRGSRVLGQAVGAFTKAREELLKKPGFVEGLAKSSEWSGGNLEDTDYAHRRAARNSWYYTGVNMRALDLVSSKYNIFLNPSGIEGEGEIVPGHPFLKVMRNPNPYMSEGLLWQYTHWWSDLKGESFWFVSPISGGGGLEEIWPLPAGNVDMEFTDDFKDIKRYVLKVGDRWYYIRGVYDLLLYR